MNKKLLFLAIIPFIIIPTALGATSITFEEFCARGASSNQITAADFICQADIFQMRDDISANKERINHLEYVVATFIEGGSSINGEAVSPDEVSLPDSASLSTSTWQITISTRGGSDMVCAENNECYSPYSLEVGIGDTVKMINTSQNGIHTFTSGTVDGFSPSPDGIFDSGMLMRPGDSFEYTTDTIGEFPYYCSLHVWEQGLLIVS